MKSLKRNKAALLAAGCLTVAAVLSLPLAGTRGAHPMLVWLAVTGFFAIVLMLFLFPDRAELAAKHVTKGVAAKAARSRGETPVGIGSTQHATHRESAVNVPLEWDAEIVHFDNAQHHTFDDPATNREIRL